MNVLEFDSLFLEFGMQRILSDVYMKCETGKIVGLLGRNGSGKSCLMKMVFGSMNGEHKSVRVNREPLLGNYLNQKVIAYLPQEGLVPSFLTLRQAASYFEVEMAQVNEIFPELAEFSGLKPTQVSTGQLRLFEVLLILLSTHPFCILDEPFSGLMPLHIEALEKVLHTLKVAKGIIVTDHLHRHVRKVADDLYVLASGKTHLIRDEAQLLKLGYLSSLS